MSESNGLTLEERATNFETMKHIHLVQHFLHRIVHDLLERAEKHDLSKLEQPEVGLFTEYTPKLAGVTYGSEEYEEFRKKMGDALAHHYAYNRHHPEHWVHGVDDMNLVDVVEMICDWAAACQRHNNGNIRKSIEVNTDRFRLSPQLVKILENTVALFDK
jgi:hypothetical protein